MVYLNYRKLIDSRTETHLAESSLAPVNQINLKKKKKNRVLIVFPGLICVVMRLGINPKRKKCSAPASRFAGKVKYHNQLKGSKNVGFQNKKRSVLNY